MNEEDKKQDEEHLSYETEAKINKTIEKFIKNSFLIPKLNEYFEEMVRVRCEQVGNELRLIRKTLFYSVIETFSPKLNHSVAATKDYVFITGGISMLLENSFEILVVKDGSIIKGPDLTYKRNYHASIVIKNYLYVLFGYVYEGNRTTMSYEKIEIPSPDNKQTLGEFYKNRTWSYYEFELKEMNKIFYHINCFNYFKTIDNTTYINGEKVISSKRKEGIKIKIKWGDCKEPAKVTFEEFNDERSEHDKKIHNEKIHIPFTDKGEWYLPISVFENSNLSKWDSKEETFILPENEK